MTSEKLDLYKGISIIPETIEAGPEGSGHDPG